LLADHQADVRGPHFENRCSKALDSIFDVEIKECS